MKILSPQRGFGVSFSLDSKLNKKKSYIILLTIKNEDFGYFSQKFVITMKIRASFGPCKIIIIMSVKKILAGISPNVNSG